MDSSKQEEDTWNSSVQMCFSKKLLKLLIKSCRTFSSKQFFASSDDFLPVILTNITTRPEMADKDFFSGIFDNFLSILWTFPSFLPDFSFRVYGARADFFYAFVNFQTFSALWWLMLVLLEMMIESNWLWQYLVKSRSRQVEWTEGDARNSSVQRWF